MTDISIPEELYRSMALKIALNGQSQRDNGCSPEINGLLQELSVGLTMYSVIVMPPHHFDPYSQQSR